MYAFEAQNVNDAFAQGITYLLMYGAEEPSRNGPVLVAPGPVCTTYLNPAQEVLFSATRDANPFFHVFEALWMLAGRNDVAFISAFNSGMAAYSDDKATFHGAYGHRWRNHFGYDQLQAIVDELTRDPASRRAVLAMWDGGQSGQEPSGEYHYDGGDLQAAASGGLDVPCNTHAYFDLRGGKLNMTVCNRSNDAIWGAYGANVVHFSTLLTYLAAALSVPVGVYRQVSNNFHVYTEKFRREKLWQMVRESTDANWLSADLAGVWRPHGQGPAWAANMQKDIAMFMRVVDTWVRPPSKGIDDAIAPVYTDEYTTYAIADVALPMFHCWRLHKAGRTEEAVAYTSHIGAQDWAYACRQWLKRRVKVVA